MPATLLSVLARVSAGALLLQVATPAILPLKRDLDDAKARRDAFAAFRAKAAKPPAPMKGVPLMRVTPAVPPTPWAPEAEVPLGPGRTLLDEEAYLRRTVSDATLHSWRAELASKPVSARRARLLLQLGEVALARHEPVEAQDRFDRAAALLPAENPDRGLARFDAALALFLQGRYQAARLAFRHAAAAPLAGVPRRLATLYARHAAACEGYHAQRAAMDIPEPPFLDPLCGAASLAVCLRGFGLPYAKADVIGKVRHDGEGSDLADLYAGAQGLGLVVRQLGADEKGLRALPKPLVAHVEHDHFVAVVAADAKGVEYVCSDCGAWPGGPVRLSWKQWRMMEADRYLALARFSTPQALVLANLPASRTQGAGRVMLASARFSNPGLVAAAQRILTAVGTSALAQTAPVQDPYTQGCGMRGQSPHCTGVQAVPRHSCGTWSLFGTGDPVNLATGEEEYTTLEGLRVYNPTGPMVDFRPSYYSVANTTPNGFGSGWTHPYNVRIEQGPPPQSTRTNGVQTNGVVGGGPSGDNMTNFLVFANSGRVSFTTHYNSPPNASTPVVHASVQAGHPLLVDWCYSQSGLYYTVTYSDRSKWTFQLSKTLPSGGAFFYPTQVADRVGNWIGLNWANFTFKTEDLATVGFQSLGLTSIVDSTGTALLTLGYDANARCVSATDRYGRSVYYAVASFANTGVPQSVPNQACDDLTDVSQIVATGAAGPPVRFHYGYANYGNTETAASETIPYLHTIAVPSPTGTGMSTATIDYSSIGEVTDTLDANGNKTLYTPANAPPFQDGTPSPAGDATVRIQDPQGNTVYRVDRYFNSLMCETRQVNGNGQIVWTATYADSNTPYGVSAVTDGNNRTWNATFDKFGHRLTVTSPKNTVTTWSYVYTSFALGELTSVQQGAKTATSYQYNEPSGLVSQVAWPVQGQATGSASTQATTYTYDALGNVTKILSPGNGATVAHSTTFGYTTDGSFSQSEGLGRPITITDTNNKVWHKRYDARGNLISQWDPLGREWDLSHNIANQTTTEYAPATGGAGAGQATTLTTYLYIGGPATKVDLISEGGVTVRTVNYVYGAEGENASRSGSTQSATLAYDGAYRTKTAKDGNGHATSYTYDMSGRLTAIAYPGAAGANYDQVLFTSYDALGNLLSRTDGNGQVTNYTYGDAEGLLSAVSYPGTTGNDVTLSYDGYDRLTSTTDGTGSSSNVYDDRGNVMSATRTYTGLASNTFSYAYWPDGSRKTMTNVAGTWTYGYDGEGRYTGLTSPAGTSSASYLDNGWQWTRTLPNGAQTTYSYDAAGDQTRVLNQTGGGSTVSDYQATGFDGAFNLTGLTASVPGASALSGTVAYGYDAKDRLTSESSTRMGGYSFSDAYDAAGNATTLRGGTATYNADNGWLSAASGACVYDGNGNPTKYNLAQTYDVEGRLNYEATAGGGTAFTAGYRADGLRAWKANGAGAKTFYLYDGGEPVVELDASGAVTAVNVFAPDGLVARKSGGAWTQYAFDLQGSVGQRLSATGTVLSTAAFDAFGRGTDTNAGDAFGYDAQSGYVRDPESQYYYCRSRYYDPMGRWVTRDPLGFRGGVNLYGYCGQGPIGRRDASGLQMVEPYEPPMDPAPSETNEEGKEEEDNSRWENEGGRPVETPEEEEEKSAWDNSYPEPDPLLNLQGHTRRPNNIPPNWIGREADNGKGVYYCDPNNPGNNIRIMDPNKFNPDGYVKVEVNGRSLDKDGNEIPRRAPDGRQQEPSKTADAHIPPSTWNKWGSGTAPVVIKPGP